MRRVRFYLLLVAGMLLPQGLAASHLSAWARAHPDARVQAAGWSLPSLLLLLNLPMAIEAVRRKRSSILPAALTGLVLQVWTAWWLGSFFFALTLAVWAPAAALVGLLRGGPSADLPTWLAVAPFLFSTYGALVGSSLMRRESVRVPVAGLPEALRGLRIVQLSDLHAGRHVSRHRLRRIAKRAARLVPDLVVVTGDHVHNSPAFARQAAEAIASIPAPLGHYACLGNHDFWAGADAVERELTRAGVQVLRNRGVRLVRGAGELWLCGVDDPWSDRFDLGAALRGRPEGAATVLLSHQPNTWPLAQKAGVELQLSGHTHGGQVALLWLHRSLSLARLITPFVAGLYRAGGSFLYVNRGAGSIVPMVRLGARPEVTELTLIDADAPEAALAAGDALDAALAGVPR